MNTAQPACVMRAALDMSRKWAQAPEENGKEAVDDVTEQLQRSTTFSPAGGQTVLKQNAGN